MESISELVANLVKANNQEYCKKVFNEFKNNGYVLKGYIKESVDEEKLICLLELSKTNNHIKWLLPDIMFLLNEVSISDKVFTLCLKYRGHYRKTILTQLAHMWLTREQLEKLNHVLETPEAFYKLLLIYLSDGNFPVDQFQEFLLINKDRLCEVLNYKEHLHGQEVNQEKMALLDQLIQKVKLA